jgi:hypothetical protein
MKSNFLAEETNNFGDVVKLQIDDDSECETRNTRLSDGGEVVGNISSKNVSKKLSRVKQSNTVKSRRGRKITNPLKCRSCAKVFNDTSNRRKHENNRVCSASKARTNTLRESDNTSEDQMKENRKKIVILDEASKAMKSIVSHAENVFTELHEKMELEVDDDDSISETSSRIRKAITPSWGYISQMLNLELFRLTANCSVV